VGWAKQVDERSERGVDVSMSSREAVCQLHRWRMTASIDAAAALNRGRVQRHAAREAEVRCVCVGVCVCELT
jgi:hypothetical protein